MTIVRRPSPFGERILLRHAMDRLFEDTLLRLGSPPDGRDESANTSSVGA